MDYLKQVNLLLYQKELKKITEITDEQVDEVSQEKDWKSKYPYLSRDCGANIHEMIEKGMVKFALFIDEQEAKSWCKGFYTIDFQKNVFISEYAGQAVSFPLDNLPSKEKYLESFKQISKTYEQVRTMS